jgi:DNA-binding transcriptional ArsR family regulator
VPTDAALRALAHDGRRRMLRLTWEGERTSGDLAAACGLSRPATSQHLKVLRAADLVTVRVDQNRRLYRARPEAVRGVLRALDELWGDRLEALRKAVE